MSERAHVTRFVSEVILISFLCAALLLFIIVISRNGDAYGAASIAKLTRLQDAPSPRLIIVGGSGSAFGIDSELIRKETAFEPVNMGLYAGFGIDYLLNQVREGAREGDTVLLIPEYDILTSTPAANGFLVLEAAQGDPEQVRFAIRNRESWVNIVRSFPGWLSTRVISVAGHIAPESFVDSEGTLYRRVYRSSMFNTYGDNIGSTYETVSLSESEVSFSSVEVIRKPVSTTTLERISAFGDDMRRIGVQVYFAWPALPQDAFQYASSSMRTHEYVITQNVGIPILGTQQDFLFPTPYFLDTINHLTAEGKEVRTTLLLEFLDAQKSN